ncbi:hypothetical protein LDO48_14175 [Pantoea agglomerans]|nr:hypothetical protein [Pantoea agglomerans]
MTIPVVLTDDEKYLNLCIAITTIFLAGILFSRAYWFDNGNTALVFAEVAAAYVIIQSGIECAKIPNEILKLALNYILKTASAAIAVIVVYSA